MVGFVEAFNTALIQPLYSRRDAAVIQNQDFVFPSDLLGRRGETEMYAYIHMRFAKYQRRSIYDQPFFQPQNSIRLPLPRELVDNIGVQYSSTELGPAIGAAADALQNASLSSIVSSIGTAITSAGTGAAAATIQNLPQLASGITRQGLQSGIQAFQAASGIAINPFQTILFKSPNFKRHNFSWDLAPKSKEESDNLNAILKLFKYHMLPGISGPGTGGVFFSYPEILQIKLFPKDEYLYDFKPCVVENISVNYAPNNPSFYGRTGAPTAVKFSISLQEIEIWTKNDYPSYRQTFTPAEREQAVRQAQLSRSPTGE